jgi:hypothetical protein
MHNIDFFRKSGRFFEFFWLKNRQICVFWGFYAPKYVFLAAASVALAFTFYGCSGDV